MTDLQNANIKNRAIKTALTGDWQAAIELNKKILSDIPDDIDTLNRLALAYTITGNIINAKKTYQKVFELDPLNSIAQRNLKRLNDKINNPQIGNMLQINCNFLEETGKTKIVELVNVAQSNIIQTLRIGQCVNLSIKRSRIFVLEGAKQYIGVLPDDIGIRLIKFIKNGNKYEAFIKSTTDSKVFIFIKEVKRVAKFKNNPSFTTSENQGLSLKKIKKND
ncbi:MAG TPA: tetratricopeptide repeat protein [Patescibacteria group bacterium]|nr:tetratricopeptide repeat protein [Patescibacteria group bacterium]